MKYLVIFGLVLLALAGGFFYLKPSIFSTDGKLYLSYPGYGVYQLQNGEVPAVTEYLKKNLNDWNSYESVSWGKLDSMGRDENNFQSFVVTHSFRAANGFGGVKLVEWYFQLDNMGNVTHAETSSQRSLRMIESETKESTERDLKRMEADLEEARKLKEGR